LAIKSISEVVKGAALAGALSAAHGIFVQELAGAGKASGDSESLYLVIICPRLLAGVDTTIPETALAKR